MLQSHLDHIVVTAPSIESGVDYLQQLLGVSLQKGGDHPRMGTHNYLLKLGQSAYLEVIAINPNAPQPGRPRWFQMDRPHYNAAIHLTTWVACTDDIATACAQSPISLGDIEPMSRGQLNWLITITRDGQMPMQGVVPSLIQWQTEIHPCDLLPDSGCTLARLEGFHPQADQINKVFAAIGFCDRFTVSALPRDQQPYLIAHIQTPEGLRQLR